MGHELYRALGYTFNDEKLLKLALTHRSSNDENNERLEFFGDSVVNFVISEAVFNRFPQAQEGDLSRWRASLVNRDTLGELGRQFDLGRYLILGQGELRSGGNQRLSIISCCMEAVIGAIYFDSDLETVRKCILRWYEPILNAIPAGGSIKDPKTQLQELLQGRKLSLPTYAVESIGGEVHQQIFVVNCFVRSLQATTTGRGASRRRAEQNAAELMLEKIKNNATK
ncbi:hypothetical protein AYO45_00160 [Gammaproteobacteria bacterium SCGC AG-212-F23]|nr:hypothetical protein AYO45_00160 [Gammaproteobacteria bacterium SCGC AG-212-F23]